MGRLPASRVFGNATLAPWVVPSNGLVAFAARVNLPAGSRFWEGPYDDAKMIQLAYHTHNVPNRRKYVQTSPAAAGYFSDTDEVTE